MIFRIEIASVFVIHHGVAVAAIVTECKEHRLLAKVETTEANNRSCLSLRLRNLQAQRVHIPLMEQIG